MLWYHFIMELKAPLFMLLLLPFFFDIVTSYNAIHISDFGLLKNVRNQLRTSLLYPLFLRVTIKRKSGTLYIVSTYIYIVPHFYANELQHTKDISTQSKQRCPCSIHIYLISIISYNAACFAGRLKRSKVTNLYIEFLLIRISFHD